jgi:branched-chain amino acid transport system permease protein
VKKGIDRMGAYQKWILCVVAACACALPLPFSPYFTGILVFIIIYAIAALGMVLLMGCAGQMSAGHNAFFGLGAYVSAILSARHGFPPALGIVLGMAATALVAYGVSKPILRFSGHMLVIVTMVIGLLFFGLASQMDFLTRGGEGFNVPRVSFAGLTIKSDIHFYYFALVVLAILLLLTRNIMKSRFGAEFQTLDINKGGSELAAESLGINIGKLKTQAFVISAVYASLSGSMYVHYITHINSDLFSLWFGFLLVIMVTIGGVSSLWGSILGAAFYVGLKEVITAVMPSGQSAALAGYEVVLFSLLFVLTLLVFRDGLASLPGIIYGKWFAGKARAASQSSLQGETDEYGILRSQKHK